jgi:hypothetical protein
MAHEARMRKMVKKTMRSFRSRTKRGCFGNIHLASLYTIYLADGLLVAQPESAVGLMRCD